MTSAELTAHESEDCVTENEPPTTYLQKMKSLAYSFAVAVAFFTLPRHLTAAPSSDQPETAVATASGRSIPLPVVGGIYDAESSTGEILRGGRQIDPEAALIRAPELGARNTSHGSA